MKRNTDSAGVGVCGVLLIIFIVLKLLRVITWSWIWVLAPLWIPIGATVVVIIVIYAILVAKAIIDNIKDQRKRKITKV